MAKQPKKKAEESPVEEGEKPPVVEDENSDYGGLPEDADLRKGLGCG